MSKSNNYRTPRALATFCAKVVSEKIATGIVLLDLKEYETAPADFFVICSSDSANQSQAILEFLLRQAKNAGLNKPRVEGETSSDWILIDFFDVVVHIMLAPIREYYNIENLWKDAVFYELNEDTGRLNKIDASKSMTNGIID